MKRKITILLILTAIFAATASALPDGLYMEPLDVSPDSPQEGDKVNVQATAYGPSNLNYMELYVNGERRKRAVCSNSLAFPTPFQFSPFGCSHQFSFTPNSAGTYDVEVKALSLLGTSTRRAEVEVTGEREDTGPRINAIEFSPSQPLPGDEVTVSVLASDISSPFTGVQSIALEADSEQIGFQSCGVFSTTCERKFRFTPDSTGEVTVTATAVGANGREVTREKSLYIREQLASSGVTGTVSSPVTLYLEMMDGVDASEYNCYWDDDDSVSESDDDMDRSGNRFEAEADLGGGDHTVYMSCFRDGKQTNTVSTSFTVEEDDNGGDDDDDDNDRPEADLEITPEDADIDEEIEFDASESEDDGEIEQYRWDFDNDGDYDRTTEDSVTEKSFNSEFDGRAKVRVRDDDGETDTATARYTVGGTCGIETGDLGLSDDRVEPGDDVEVWANVENTGDERQRVTASFTEDSDEFSSRTRRIDADDSYNFTATLEARRTVEIESNITTKGEPCGFRDFTDYRDLEVDVEGISADFDYEPDNPNVDETVEFDASDTVSENDIERYSWDFDDGNSKLGETVEHSFNSKDDYRVELEVEDEDGETDRVRKTVEVGGSDGDLTVTVEDENGNELEDARVRVTNGDTDTENTDRDGEASFELGEGYYEVEVSKDGYRTRTKTVEIEDDREDLDFELESTTSSELRVEVTDGTSSLDGARVTVDGNTRIARNGRAAFDLPEGDYEVKAELDGYRTVTRTVQLEEDDRRTLRIELRRGDEPTAPGAPEDVSVSVTLEPSQVSYGDSVMVKGFVDGARGNSNVEISRNGNELASVSTQPDGYYQAFITPERVGASNIKVEVNGKSSSAPLRVNPTVSVSGVNAPRKVFEGTRFDVCATIESQVSTTVRLYRNGEQLDSRMRRGNTCFTTEAPTEPGNYRYEVVSVVPGAGDSEATNVQVLEVDEEVSSFPGNVATVEAESGMIKVDLYNTKESMTRYQLQLTGIDESWYSQTDESVVLGKGERKTVYFYIQGREEGVYQPTISVSSDGTTVFSEQVMLNVGGTKSPQKKGWFASLRGLIPL